MDDQVRPWQFIYVKWFHMKGITIFPFIMHTSKHLPQNKRFVQHEHIHLRQQRELFVLLFYALYLLHYTINLIKYRHHDKAYRNICFEREAYQNESQPQYLRTRKWMAWTRYL